VKYFSLVPKGPVYIGLWKGDNRCAKVTAIEEVLPEGIIGEVKLESVGIL
jgi:hypothetical protein